MYKRQSGEAKHGMGSKWTLKTLQKRLAGMGVDVPTLWGEIHDVVIKTLIAIEAQVKHQTSFVPVETL